MTDHVSFRLSEEARGLLLKLSRHFGISMTAVLEFVIRGKAREVLPKSRSHKKLDSQ